MHGVSSFLLRISNMHIDVCSLVFVPDGGAIGDCWVLKSDTPFPVSLGWDYGSLSMASLGSTCLLKLYRSHL